MTALADVVLAILAGGLVLAFLRLARGPSLPERVVALDLMATISVAMAGVYSVGHGQTIFLDVAIVLALISFVGTVAFAEYVGRRAREERP